MSTASTLRETASTDLADGRVADAFDRLKRAAAIAMLDQDWSEALRCYIAIRGLIGSFGSTTKQSGNVQTRIEWSGESLDSIISGLETKAAAAAWSSDGMTSVPYRYVRPEAEE